MGAGVIYLGEYQFVVTSDKIECYKKNKKKFFSFEPEGILQFTLYDKRSGYHSGDIIFKPADKDFSIPKIEKKYENSFRWVEL